MNTKILFRAIAPALLFSTLLVVKTYAQDKHIDPFATFTKYNLTFSRHVSATMTDATIDASLLFANDILQICDNKTNAEQDVACQVGFARNGDVTSFGTAADALNIVLFQSDLDIVKAKPGFIKIVTKISLPGVGDLGGQAGAIGSSTLAIATESGGTTLNSETVGQVILHEFGHCQGLLHRQHPGEPSNPFPDVGNALMSRSITPGVNNEVNASEATTFHNGFNGALGDNTVINRPVNVEFIIDDTGSMSEEIDGVKNQLLALLNDPAYAVNPCATVFQLTTFKDNVTMRDPTSDLTTIKNQVSVLFADGGGDCPEASVEATITTMAYIKDGGKVFFVTDANPHPGVDLETVAAELAGRGIEFNTLLSGECFGSPTIASSLASAMSGYSSSDNNDTHWNGVSPTYPSSIVTFPTATESYSYICSQTGGVFTFVPEVNSGQPNDQLRYEHIGFNILLGFIKPTITIVEPKKAPVGGTVALTVRGSKLTSFNASTTVSFNDPNITVSNVTVVNPNKLLVTAHVANGAALGFKNITATTDVGGGIIRDAPGLELLEVTTAPTSPTILSIAPGSGIVGQTLDVTVTGINTTFDNTSVLDLGTGITVLTHSALNNSELLAHIKIDADAITGFRNVVVTTGTEVATESVPGPFLVIGSVCGSPPILNTIDASTPNSFCNSLQLSAAFTPGASPGDESFHWSYGGNPVFANSQFVNLTPANGDGLYSVVVQDKNGCESNALSFDYHSKDNISSYAVYAYKEAKFGEKNTINGAVGVKNVNGKIEIKKNSVLPLPFFAKAASINVAVPATVPLRILLPAANVPLPGMTNYNGNTKGLPNFNAPENSVLSFGNAKDVKIKKKANVTLTGDNYGKIEIESGAEVTFTNSIINLNELKTHNGAGNDFTKINFSSNAVLKVSKKVDFGDRTVVNSTSQKVVFYLSDKAPDQEKFTVHGNTTNVTANVFLPVGKLKVMGGNGTEKAFMTGLFIAEKVESTGKNVIWNSFNCTSPFGPAITPRFANEGEPSFDENYDEALNVFASPNPSADNFKLDIQSDNDAPVSISIINAEGNRVEFIKETQPNQTISVGAELKTGVYFAVVVQNDLRKIVKLIKVQ